MKRIILIWLVVLALNMICIINKVYATKDPGVDQVITAMKGTSDASGVVAKNSNTQKVINNVIGILQFVGSGISIIVITIMGLKYILASPAEKADVKKTAIPIIVGCLLLFGAVNLVGAIEDFSAVLQ